MENVAGAVLPDERKDGDAAAAELAPSTVAPVEEFEKEILSVSSAPAAGAKVEPVAVNVQEFTCTAIDDDAKPFRAVLRSELAAVVQALLTAKSKDEMIDSLAAVGLKLVRSSGS